VSERPRHGSGKYRVRENAPAVIRAAREGLGWSQARLGRKAFNLEDEQAAYNAVSRLEKGDASAMRFMDAAGAMGLALGEVIEFIPDSELP
jgi:ribosome-binding protein aMBF1 (putative translation factor)